MVSSAENKAATIFLCRARVPVPAKFNKKKGRTSVEHEEIIKVVEEMNESIPPELHEEGMTFEYATNGYVQIVRFCGFVVYCSEENMSEDVKEAGGLKNFIAQRTNFYTELIMQIR